MYNKETILKKKYETPNEYVLETLQKDIENIYEELESLIPKEIEDLFNKYIEVQSYIHDLEVNLAFKNGQDLAYNSAKKILLEKLKNYEF